ncbi:MAG: carbohydrate kinase family protein [Ignavibacteriae bacterium]|nr:carbohydrate kinase family protein [Ignavibacteriota bacterium]MCB9075916.1 carbohydrate kinase family protein [Chitinophagales bacterium]MCB9247729.1 carbohydrate kinase family protein [Ignavibacteriales bacterium]MCB0742260.1 carbohydrate kinase family protein [Ignavibacteriota bacterium]MCB0745846.1 carbohydrate kinase family protein [Ignavibacteriota bacterium]
MNKDFDVIVIGELNVDLILNQIDSFPEIGKEKLADKMDLVLGSSSAIFASNLSSLGAKVSFIGKIGNDIFGNLVLDSLKNKNVNTDLIIIDDELKTGATVVLNFDQDRAMVTHSGAMEHLSIEDIKIEKLKRAKHIHVSSIFLQPELKDNLFVLFKSAKENGLTTSLDPQWDPAEKWDLDLEQLLPYVDVFLPNEVEITKLTQTNKVDESINKIKNFANSIIVKEGNKGSVSYSKNIKLEVAAYLNDNVIDAIGAGDSFDAGFIFKYVSGESIENCQKFGNLTGAINTTSAGGTSAFKNYTQIVELGKNKFGFEE